MSVDFLPNRATPSQIEAARAHLERRARLYNLPVSKPKPIYIAPPEPEPVEVVAEEAAIEDDTPLTAWSVKRAICKKYRLTIDELRSTARRKDIVRARHECFYLMRYEVPWIGQQGMSLHAIARQFGRDHTTILHGIRQHTRRLAGEIE